MKNITEHQVDLFRFLAVYIDMRYVQEARSTDWMICSESGVHFSAVLFR